MARRRKHGGGEHGGGGGHERWLITYADLITLLTVFFITLYSFANADLDKFEKLAGSLANTFHNVGILPGTKPVPEAIGGGDGILAAFESKVGEAASDGLGTRAAGGGETAVAAQREADFQYISNEIARLVTARGVADRVSVTQNQEGIVINLTGDLLFFNARADLRPESFPVLDGVAEILRQLTNPVRIEGHTDSIPPQNPEFPTNWHLSGARALAVLQFLEQFGGIERDRLHYQAWADLKPVADNSVLEGRLQNRRASVVILYPDRQSLVEGTGTAPEIELRTPQLPRIFPIGVLPLQGTGAALAQPSEEPRG